MADSLKLKYAPRESLAMRWAAHDPSSEFKTFYLLNRAKNYDDYRNAIQYFECPSQNFIFGAVNGDIAITQQGKFPVKWPEQGRFILGGSDTLSDWRTYIPFEQNPTIKNPNRGFVSSANQHPTDSTYPYYYTSFDFEFYRNRVINNALSNMSDATIKDMMNLQQSNFNMLASETLPLMLQQLNINNSITQILGQWNFNNDANSEAATYFQIWWNKMYDMLWDEFKNTGISLTPPDKYATASIIKNQPDTFKYYDNRETDEKETFKDILEGSFQQMTHVVDSLHNINSDTTKWYEWKSTDILHIALIPAFSRMDIENGGYRNIVNATSETYGPSWRMIVELSDPINAYGIYPGGQSGNPGSKYYDNFIDDWAEGRYYKLNFYESQSDASKNAIFTLALGKW
jgi:penicillin amidase